MSELYTSLTRLKMAMNGGELPAMTAIPLTAQTVIDPKFTIGLGALVEDEVLGLRCPVRGCGIYRHALTRHVDAAHPEIGGSEGLKLLLEIPRTFRLASSAYRANLRETIARRGSAALEQLARARLARPGATQERFVRDRANITHRKLYKLAGMRNLTNRCEAQMRHALIDLQNKIGRSPTRHEADSMIGQGFVGQVIQIYGSWNAAKARFGLEQYKRGHSKKEITREAVLEALRAYYEKNGTLPNVNQAQRPNRTPLIPSRPTILKAMGTELWPEAMRRVASILGIYGGRYGLPLENRPSEVAA